MVGSYAGSRYGTGMGYYSGRVYPTNRYRSGWGNSWGNTMRVPSYRDDYYYGDAGFYGRGNGWSNTASPVNYDRYGGTWGGGYGSYDRYGSYGRYGYGGYGGGYGMGRYGG